MPTIQELREERAGLFEQMKAITDKADAESRDLTAEETAEWNKIDADIDSKQKQIESIEDSANRAARMAELHDSMSRPAGRRTQATATTEGKPAGNDGAFSLAVELGKAMTSEGIGFSDALESVAAKHRNTQAMGAFRTFIVKGEGGLNPQERAALSVDAEGSGGYTVVPEEFLAQLIKFVDNMVFIRGIATVLPMTNADSIGVPSLENDPADADWTSELMTGSEDSTMSFGARRLQPNPLAKSIKISKTLLRKSAIPIEQLVRDRLGYKFAVTEEQAFLTGTGTNQPLGVFTASATGVTTSQDVSTGNTTTDITADGLINCKYDLKAQYMASPSLRWVFSRTAVRNIRKLKDGNGQYLWQAGLAGTPDSILEVPYLMSEYVPSTFTSGLYVGILGDFRHYWIAESLKMELQRLDELYAATNQVGFIGRMELDAMPVLAEAFRRVKLA